jgi:alpha-1,2-mannosyltransferase
LAGVLRLPPGRARLWAIGLFFIGLALIVGAPFFGYHDWPDFWSAGHVVGTLDLVDAERLLAWQVAHGLPPIYFPYPPAAAFVLVPFALLSLGVSFWVHAALMLLCAVGAGVVGARAFGLPRSIGVLSTLAWAPITGAIAIGQNTPLALFVASVAILGLVERRPRWAGGAIGLLLYKPTLGLPLAGLLVLRRRWFDLGLVIVAGLLWYGIGVLAAAGDLRWPVTWIDGLRGWLQDDIVRNADKAVSLPGLVSRLAVPDWLPPLVGVAMVVVALPRLIRAPIREAAAGALVVGVAASPHAWGYEAALLLPFVWWALAGGLAEPWRTRLVVAAYVIVPFWMISSVTQVSAVAFVVIGAYVIWVGGLWRRGTVAGSDAPGTSVAVEPAINAL